MQRNAYLRMHCLASRLITIRPTHQKMYPFLGKQGTGLKLEQSIYLPAYYTRD